MRYTEIIAVLERHTLYQAGAVWEVELHPRGLLEREGLPDGKVRQHWILKEVRQVEARARMQALLAARRDAGFAPLTGARARAWCLLDEEAWLQGADDQETYLAFELGLLDDPDGPDPSLRYARWLSEHGQPRGDLALVQHALAEHPPGPSPPRAQSQLRERAHRLLREHRDLLCGWLGGVEGMELCWHQGFIRSASFLITGEIEEDEVDGPRLLEMLLWHPSARMLRELTVRLSLPDDGRAYRGITDVLRQAGVRPTLRRLVLDGDCSGWLERLHADDFGPLWALYPRLGELVLPSGEELGIERGPDGARKLRLEYAGRRSEAAAAEAGPAERLLAEALASPSGNSVEDIVVQLWRCYRDYSAVMDVLMRHGPYPRLRRIHIDFAGTDHERQWAILDGLHGLYGHCPVLESLTLPSGELDLGVMDLPALRELTLDAARCQDPEQLSAAEREDFWLRQRSGLRFLSTLRCPRLEQLSIDLCFRNYTQWQMEDLRPLLHHPGLPRLVHLRLLRVPFLEELCRELVASPLVRQLKVLDLPGSRLTDDAAATLLAWRASLGHLEQLIVDGRDLSPSRRNSLRSLCSNVVLDPGRYWETSLPPLSGL